MGKWIESMAKKARESKLARQERYENLGIDCKDVDATSAIDAVDLLYRFGGFRQPGGLDPPSQIVFFDSPLSMCLSIRAVQKLLDGAVTNETVWKLMKKEVATLIDDAVWARSEAYVLQVDLNAIKQPKLVSIIQDRFGIVHYVEKTIECESVKYMFARKWHNTVQCSVGQALTDKIESLLGKNFERDIGPCISAWIVVNQRAFDMYLHQTRPQSTDPEDDGIFNGYLLEPKKEAEQRRDYGLFTLNEKCHLLFPAQDICFVCRKPAIIRPYAYETSRSKRKSTIEYLDGFGF